MKRLSTIVVLLPLCACLDPLAEFDFGELRCASDADCPSGQICAEDISACVDESDALRSPPAVLSAELSPGAFARQDTVINVKFTLDQTLVERPEILLIVEGGGLIARLEAVEGLDEVGPAFEYEYPLRGDEPEGRVEVVASVVGASGVPTELSLGQLVLDFTPPSLDLRFDNAALALSDGGAGRLEVGASEPVALTVVMHEDQQEIDWQVSGDAEGRAFEVSFVADQELHDELTYALRFAAEDRAGNVVLVEPDKAVIVDYTAPVVTLSTNLGGDVAGPNQTLQVTLSSPEPLARAPRLVAALGDFEFTFTLTGASEDPAAYHYERVVRFGEPQGTYALVASDILDIAGNPGAQSAPASVSVDAEPPAVVVVPPAQLSFDASSTVVLELCTSEQVALPPGTPGGAAPLSVTLSATPMTCAAQTACSDGDLAADFPLSISCELVLSGVDIEADFITPRLVVAADLGGNETFAFALDPPVFQIDSTPPALVGFAPALDPALTSGDTVLVTVEANEPLALAGECAAAAELVFSGPSLPFTLEPLQAGASSARLALVIDGANPPSGSYLLDAVRLCDRAGNLSDPIPVGRTFVIDRDAPLIENLDLPATSSFSLQAGFDTVAFEADFSPDASLEISLDGEPIANPPCVFTTGHVSCALAVADLGGEGFHQLLLEATDPAGNISAEDRTLIFDFTPPALVSALPAADAAFREGTTIVVEVEADEPLGSAAACPPAPAALAFTGPALPLAPQPIAPGATTARFELLVDALSPAEDVFLLESATLCDEVGNRAAPAPLPRSLEVDRTAPTVVSFPLAATETFSLQPGFNSVDFTVELSEANLAVEVLFDGVPRPPGDCALVDTTLTCGFAVEDENNDGEDEVHRLLVLATDSAGNSASESRILVYDFTAPDLTGVPAVEITPLGPLLIAAPTAAASGATMFFSFFTDEPALLLSIEGRDGLNTFPVTETGAPPPGETRITFTAQHQVLPPDVDGSYTVFAELADTVGNVATRSAGDVIIDTTPPAAVDVEQLLFRRAEWGLEDSGTFPAPIFEVESQGTPFEPGATVVFFDQAAPLGATEIGRLSAGENAGGASATPVTLQAIDRQEVFVVQVDGAGNLDENRRTFNQFLRLPRVEWVATMGNKGGALDLFPNPNALRGQPRLESRRDEQHAELLDGAGLAPGGTTTTRFSELHWREIAGVDEPVNAAGAMSGPMATWDSSLGMVVLSATDTDDETWAFDGGLWSSVAAGPGVEEGAIFFDPTLGAPIIFGGDEFASASPATRIFDGSDWLQLETGVSSPPASVRSSAAVHVERGMGVLFGGRGAVINSAAHAETWAFKGGGWTQLFPPAAPSARSSAAMAWDVDNGNVVLFGGHQSLAAGELQDTWVFDGETWTEQLPATVPPARRGAAMVFDPTGSEILLIGGHAGAVDLVDVWAWDGVDWSPRPALSAGGASVGGEFAVAVADPIRSNVVYVVDDPSGNRGILIYDGVSWENALTNPASHPGGDAANTSQCVGYDATTEEVVMVRSTIDKGTQPFALGSHAWDVGLGIPARPGHSMNCTFDGDRELGVILSTIGGAHATDEVDDNVLTEECSGCGLVDRDGATLMWHPDSSTTFLFSGGSTENTDTFRYVPSTTWSLAAPSPQLPTARQLAGATGYQFSGAPGVDVVLFGGEKGPAFLQDTWRFDGTNWTQVFPLTSPAARSRHGMAHDPSRNLAFLYGGKSASPEAGSELWVFVNDNWALPVVNDDAAPPLRQRPGMAYDALRDRVVIHGESGVPDAETWVLELDQAPRAALLFDARFGDRQPASPFSLTGVTALFRANGTNGASLVLWDQEEYRDLVTVGPGPISALTFDSSTIISDPDPAVLHQKLLRLFVNGAVRVGVASAAQPDLFTQESVIADYAELRVQYRLD